ncbi:MAG TPA: hypothetical protein VFM21_12340 [Terriglobia bacterium]|nr:hypothetical protein [Terriglobia bacterium]
MAEPTSTHTFFRSPFSRQQGQNRRRSTRLDIAIPVTLTGRDARGQSFREETQTATVNLHGAKVSTQHEILVGMQVTVENPLNGALEKAVCVRVYEPVPDETGHYVALQLIRPGNIWGIEEPPQDWVTVAANMLGGARYSSPVPAPSEKRAAESAIPIFESQAVSLEQQAATLTDTVLQTFRQQIEVLTNAALQDFQNRLRVIEGEASARLRERREESLAGVTSVVDAMREDAAAQMASSVAEVVAAAEKEVRAKVAEILAPLADLDSNPSPDKPGITYSRK